MKGQLFLVSFVFAVGLIFLIQQSLFQYTDIDVSEPEKGNEFFILKSTLNSINETLLSTDVCDGSKESFRERIGESITFFEKESRREFFTTQIDFDLDCNNWENTPPATPPLDLRIKLIGPGVKASGTFQMYHLL